MLGSSIRVAIRTLSLLLLSLLSLCPLWAGTVTPAEGGAVQGLVGFIRSYEILNGEIPTSWSEIARYDTRLKTLNSHFKDEQGIDHLYSFIHADDRSKFPKGELLLIKSTAMDWPRVWNSLGLTFQTPL